MDEGRSVSDLHARARKDWGGKREGTKFTGAWRSFSVPHATRMQRAFSGKGKHRNARRERTIVASEV